MNNIKVICPYCGNEAEWVDNAVIYGRRYGKSYMMWWCRKDDARVGCHNNTKQPLGRMANKVLRNWRIRVHAQIDPLWQSGLYTRGHIYRKLSKALGYEYHTANTDVKDCQKILQLIPTLFSIQDQITV